MIKLLSVLNMRENKHIWNTNSDKRRPCAWYKTNILLNHTLYNYLVKNSHLGFVHTRYLGSLVNSEDSCANISLCPLFTTFINESRCAWAFLWPFDLILWNFSTLIMMPNAVALCWNQTHLTTWALLHYKRFTSTSWSGPKWTTSKLFTPEFNPIVTKLTKTS